MLCVSVITRQPKLVMLTDGSICVVDKFINTEGDDTESVDDALTVIFHHPAVGWTHALIHDFCHEHSH